MNSKTKPKYNIAQNVAWMVKNAWTVRKRVLWIGIAIAMLEILYSIEQLYIAPEILKLVEQHASLDQLILAIALFTAALFFTQGFKGYLSTNATYPQIDVRSHIIGLLAHKCNTTSYPNTLLPDFIKLREKAHDACDSNQSATEYIWQCLTSLLTNIVGFFLYLSLLSNLNFTLILVVLVTCLLNFRVSQYTNNWVYNHREEESAFYVKKSYIRRKSQAVTLAKDIRIFGLQTWLNDLLDSVHNTYLIYRLKVEKKHLAAGAAEAVLTMARNGIAYWYLIRLALNEGLSVSEFLLYFTAVSTFTTWVMGILKDTARLHKDSLDINIVRECLEYPEPFRFDDGDSIEPADSYELILENVSYRYPGADKDSLHGVDLVIRPGEKLAVVGLNGAGKTTLVKLLCGLLDPTEGRVLLNGRDIREFDRRDYYTLFSAVFQDFSILDVTVAETVAQATENIDYDKVNRCLNKAGLSQAIAVLPKGIHTHVGRDVFLDGVLFSGGQTQRLMLARALYKDGPILVLDEPTAALDPIAENDIYQKYDSMTTSKTSVFISHRLASTRFCDRILFLADGRIAEEGTHESLLALNGDYAKLFEIQSRYYQEGRDF